MFEQKKQFEDQRYFKTTLQVVSALCFFGTGLLGIQSIAFGHVLPNTIGLFAGMLFSGAMFFLTLRNNLTLPRYLTPPVTYGIVVFLVFVGEGNAGKAAAAPTGRLTDEKCLRKFDQAIDIILQIVFPYPSRIRSIDARYNISIWVQEGELSTA